MIRLFDPVCAAAALVVSAAAQDFTSPRLEAVTSWIGNSYGGAKKWVQQDIHAMAVMAEGTVFTNVGWDEAGGTYDHVPPGAVPPPDPDAPAGELGFTFDRSGYRVPAILVSPWVPKGAVFNGEYRHTSLIATLRKRWNLGEPFTRRDASARTFDDLFTLDEPRDPHTWATPTALPVPAWHLDEEALAQGLSGLGKTMGAGLIERARQLGVTLPPQVDDPNAEITPDVIIDVLREVSWHSFPLLRPA